MLNAKTDTRHRAYNFSLAIIKLLKDLPQTKTYMIFSDQPLRSATSMGVNLVEAKASSSRKDFLKFYQISLKSANETAYWLCLMRDGKLIEENRLDSLIKEVSEISRMLGASLLTLKGRRQI